MIINYIIVISLDVYTVGLWLMVHDTHSLLGTIMCLAAVGVILAVMTFPVAGEMKDDDDYMW